MYPTLLKVSDWLCRALSFALKMHPRLAPNFEERLVSNLAWANEIQNSPKKIWIQAASLGEALLAAELALKLAEQKQELGLLLTSCTPEGRGELLKVQAKLKAANSSLKISVALFPLFTQTYMRLALNKLKPNLVVLLETELWPGLLLACAENKVPLITLNARMSERSFKRYKLSQALWDIFDKANTPTKIAAISEADALRYKGIFKNAETILMPNIKFDRATNSASPEKMAELSKILPSQNQANQDQLSKGQANSKILILASVRNEEEAMLGELISRLHKKMPSLIIIIVPKHLQRANAWQNQLTSSNTQNKVRLRTELSESLPANSGELIIWNSVGELSALYAFASSVFVGGSLAALGGQNFLEPLNYGITPHIGLHWKNFAWVGRELIEQGLVKEIQNISELEASLSAELEYCPNEKYGQHRQENQAKAKAWLAKKQGGTQQAIEIINSFITN